MPLELTSFATRIEDGRSPSPIDFHAVEILEAPPDGAEGRERREGWGIGEGTWQGREQAGEGRGSGRGT